MSNFQRVLMFAVFLAVLVVGHSGYRWVWGNYTSVGRLCTKGTETEAEIDWVSEPYDIRADTGILASLSLDEQIKGSFNFKYKFTLDGMAFRGSGHVTDVAGQRGRVFKQKYPNSPVYSIEEKTFKDEPKVGNRLKIAYDPADPKNSETTENLRTDCGPTFLDKVFNEATFKIVFGFGATVLLSFVAKSFRYTKRFGVKPAEQVLRKDLRPLVLYLRPFEFHDISTRATTLEAEPQDWLTFGMSIEKASYEEALASVLDEIGPCITVSEPGHEEPVVGFSRLKLTEANWQSEVEELLRQSALVLLCTGSSPGIKWEFEKAAALVPRQRLLILITSNATDEWWDEADEILKCKLPRISSDPEVALTGFIYFDETGKPLFDTLLASDSMRIKKALRKALQPVLLSIERLEESTPR